MTKRSAQAGFSLVEVLLVVVIVGFIALLIANLPNSFILTSSSNHQSTAKEIAVKQIESLRTQGYDSLANGTSQLSDTRITRLPSGSATMVIADCPQNVCSNGELIKQVTITVHWKDNDKDQQLQFDTLIAKGGIK